MSDTSPSGFASAYRVLSVRTSDDTRAQLEVLAQLNNRSVTEETRIALEAWVEHAKSDPKIHERAAAVRAEIEREAETKRNAIEAIFGTENTSSSSSQKANSRTTKQAEA